MNEKEAIAAGANTAANPMPSWKCHKVVQAVKIKAVKLMDIPNVYAIVEHAELCPAVVITEAEFRRIARPKTDSDGNDIDLGYLVRYEDGYTSWSPSAAFEAGYTRVRTDGPVAASDSTEGAS